MSAHCWPLTSSNFCCLLRSSISRSEGRRCAISSSLCNSSLRCSNTLFSSGFSSSSKPLCDQPESHTIHSPLTTHRLERLEEVLRWITVCDWAGALGEGSGNLVSPLRNHSVSWDESCHHCSPQWTVGTVGQPWSLRNPKQIISVWCWLLRLQIKSKILRLNQSNFDEFK